MLRRVLVATAVAIAVVVAVYALELLLVDRGLYPESCDDTADRIAACAAPRPSLWLPLLLGMLAGVAVWAASVRRAAAPGRNRTEPSRDA
jgi:NADPH-dependent 2,4-dienoyl-CoA reductase/sulfur reductase-like enzyme